MSDLVDVRIGTDAVNLLCGSLIGEGIHRKVFECKIRPDLVVKLETNTNYRDFANVHEMQIWNDNEYAPAYSKWLAPCEYLSPDGYILLQKKVTPLRPEELPAKLPAFLTDIKPENFGMYDGRVVCVDYRYIVTQLNKQLKKVEW